MNKKKLSRGKFPLFTILSLGAMILGIGCIIWAMFKIWAPTYYSEASHSSKVSTKVNVDKKSLPVENADGINGGSNSSIAKPSPDKTLYPVYPVEGEDIGSLTIPALKRKLSIFQGTDEKQLDKGVGHFTQSVLPGEKDNCVISGHRDTVFRQVGNLKIGDQLIVETSAGKFTYEVSGTRIVHADDKTVIVPFDHAVLTMTTCYPFYAIGNAPDRYIVSANLVKSE